MNLRILKLIRLFLLLPGLLISTSIQAGWIETEIVHVKAGRLYLGAGYNEYVLPDGRCRIISEIDTLEITTIESVLPGISYTKPIDSTLLNSLVLRGSNLQVETYDIDSSGIIELYLPHTRSLTDNSGIFYFDQNSLDLPVSNKISIHELDRSVAIISGTEIHGLVEFARPTDDRSQIYAAPFIAIMAPNLSNKINRGGLLSTALYYNFDDSLHPLYNFDGVTKPAHSFNSRSDNSKRSYPFDRFRGNELLRQCTNSNTRIKINSGSKHLTGIRNFFADHLVAERIQVSIEDESNNYDISISWISFDTDDLFSSFNNISEFLNDSASDYSTISKTIELFNLRLSSSLSISDTTSNNFYIGLLERSLHEDYGIFPLFRPYLVFRQHELLRGVQVMSNGKLDLSNAVLLKLPDQEDRP